MNALRNAADGEGGFFFSGPIRLGVDRAQVRREAWQRPTSASKSLPSPYAPLHIS